MLQTNTNDYSVANFDHVIVEKTKLLETVRANKEKHALIYEAACSGYWIEAQERLEQKKLEFGSGIAKLEQDFTFRASENEKAFADRKEKELKDYNVYLQFSTKLNLSYPTNHLNDYDRTITMLEFSVADKVSLPIADFEKYVRNNWEWKNDFCASNQSYVGRALYTTGALNSFASGANGIYLSGFALNGAKSY